MYYVWNSCFHLISIRHLEQDTSWGAFMLWMLLFLGGLVVVAAGDSLIRGALARRNIARSLIQN